MSAGISNASAVRNGSLHTALRDAILNREVAPGTAVTETAVAVRYGVARPTARLAIERLVGEGLLRREPHQAARIPVLTGPDIADIFDSRALVEQAAIERLGVRVIDASDAGWGIINHDLFLSNAQIREVIRRAIDGQPRLAGD